MSDGEREELAALVRGWSAYFEWARESGAASLSRTEGISLRATLSTEAATPAEPVAQPSAAARPQPAPVAPSSPAPVARLAEDSPRVSVSAPSRVEPPQREPVASIERPAPAPPTVVTAAPVHGEHRLRALSVLEDEARACKRCRLCEGRTQAVFSRGNCEAELFFVGEAPGADEDRVGKPFVGAAGRLLDRILTAMGMSEDDVYIANVAKCRPPNNRPPEDDEAAACGPFLDRQLALVRPKVIVAWGRTPTRYLLKKTESMSKLRGNWYSVDGVPVLPTWHPAYLLRNPDAKKDTWADMKRVLEKLGRPLPAPTRG
ncbi:MAG: uracil-DNA glycosylase family protein [Polyangiales bacterium]